MNSTVMHGQMPARAKPWLYGLSVLGVVGLVLTALLGFEEPPNAFLLGVSAAMAFAAPMAVLAHLATTRTLTFERKRVWMREFASAEVWAAMAEYLSSANLSKSADRRASEAHARRVSRKAEP